MNTNGNLYTIIYTTVVVVLVAAILAFASMSLQPRQKANIKAETISQMLTAAHFFTKEELGEMSNDQVLAEYSKHIDKAFTVNAAGEVVSTLGTEKGKIEIADGLKAQNAIIKAGNTAEEKLPVYVFNKEGKKVTVVPCYGAGLWGPVWGYIAFDEDLSTIIGVYFDHESETPGLGAKIKDEPSFREEFVSKKADFSSDEVFAIVKSGTGNSESTVDAITGATMTSNGLSHAISTWLGQYKGYFTKNAAAPLPVQADTLASPVQEAVDSAALAK